MIRTANIIFQNKKKRDHRTRKKKRRANEYIADIRQVNELITEILKQLTLRLCLLEIQTNHFN
jgi:hypothetical protein